LCASSIGYLIVRIIHPIKEDLTDIVLPHCTFVIFIIFFFCED
jgi:hypothetical protein